MPVSSFNKVIEATKIRIAKNTEAIKQELIKNIINESTEGNIFYSKLDNYNWRYFVLKCGYHPLLPIYMLLSVFYCSLTIPGLDNNEKQYPRYYIDYYNNASNKEGEYTKKMQTEIGNDGLVQLKLTTTNL